MDDNCGEWVECMGVVSRRRVWFAGGMGGGGWLLTSLFLIYYLYSWASML